MDKIYTYSLCGITLLILLAFLIESNISSTRETFLSNSSPIDMSNTDVYLINMKKNDDRLEHFINTYMKSDLRYKKFKRFEGVDGTKVKIEEHVSSKALIEITMAESTGYRTKHYQLTRGAVGCYLSHLGVYKLIANGDKDFCIIMEDDIRIDPNIMMKLNGLLLGIPDSWDILLLGCWCVVCDPHKTYYDSHRFYLLHAYVIKKKAAAKIVELLEKKKITQQIDSELSDMVVAGNLSVFCLKDAVAHQANSFDTTIQLPMKVVEGVNPFATP